MTGRGGKENGRARDPGVSLEIAVTADDARRLIRLAAAAKLTVEACAASILSSVLADDAMTHGEGHGEGAGR